MAWPPAHGVADAPARRLSSRPRKAVASVADAVSPNTAVTPGYVHVTAARTPGSLSATVAGRHVGPDAAANHAAGPVSGTAGVETGGAAVVRGAAVVTGAWVTVGWGTDGPAVDAAGVPPPRPRRTATAAITASAPRTPATSGQRGLRGAGEAGGGGDGAWSASPSSAAAVGAGTGPSDRDDDGTKEGKANSRVAAAGR